MELNPPPLDPGGPAARPSPGQAPLDYDFGLSGLPVQKELPLEEPKKAVDENAIAGLSEEDAIVELAALRLQRACQDMVDEARAEALMSRIVRSREEAFGFDEDATSGPDESRGGSGGEPPATPRTFARHVSARRLALAALAIALLVATPAVFGGNPLKWPERASAFFAPAPVIAASAVEWRRDTIVRTNQTAAVEQALAAKKENAWRVNLAERLAVRAIPVGEEKAAGSVESGLQEWHERNGARTVRLVPEDEVAQGQAQAQQDGVTLAVASAAEGFPPAAAAAKDSVFADGIIRLDDKAAAKAEPERSAGQEARKTELAALVSPRPEDVLAAANAREAERSAKRLEEQKPAPRDPRVVEIALASTAAVADLRPSQRRELAERLAGGECLATSLGDYFSPVPVLLMRDLIRNLDSEC